MTEAKPITRDTFVKSGRKGGSTTYKIHGVKHFKKAAATRWKKAKCKSKSK